MLVSTDQWHNNVIAKGLPNSLHPIIPPPSVSTRENILRSFHDGSGGPSYCSAISLSLLCSDGQPVDVPVRSSVSVVSGGCINFSSPPPSSAQRLVMLNRSSFLIRFFTIRRMRPCRTLILMCSSEVFVVLLSNMKCAHYSPFFNLGFTIFR